MLKIHLISTLVLRSFDIIAVIVCAYIAYSLRFDTLKMPSDFLYVTIIGTLLFQALNSYKNIYTSWRGHYGFQLTKRLFLSWLISGLLLFALLTITQKADEFSRLWLAYWWAATLITAAFIKATLYAAAAYLRTKGYNSKNVLIIGTSELSTTINKQLILSPWAGYKTLSPASINDSRDETCLNLKAQKADEIWIALPISQGKEIQELLFRLRNFTHNIRLIPEISDLRLLNHKTSQIAGLHTIDLSMTPIYGTTALLKRATDIILSLIIIFLVLPVLAVISIFIRITSPGPILFKQMRNGIHGKQIYVYKFRSMHTHTEKNNKVTQAQKNDARITPLGSFLRRSSLDELPQFFNVLQGRMSIVGPRPHAIAHNEEYKEKVESYMRRHKVKPGITGWAQINGYRGETDTLEKMEKRVEFDLYYIDNWSLWLDFRIIVMTVFKGFFNNNAY